jgi:hypothetical protein
LNNKDLVHSKGFSDFLGSRKTYIGFYVRYRKGSPQEKKKEKPVVIYGPALKRNE